jgi:cell division protein FtsL
MKTMIALILIAVCFIAIGLIVLQVQLLDMQQQIDLMQKNDSLTRELIMQRLY